MMFAEKLFNVIKKPFTFLSGPPKKWEKPAGVVSFLYLSQYLFRAPRFAGPPPSCMKTYRIYEQCAKEEGPGSSMCDGFKDLLMEYCRAVDDGNSLIVDVELLKQAEDRKKAFRTF